MAKPPPTDHRPRPRPTALERRAALARAEVEKQHAAMRDPAHRRALADHARRMLAAAKEADGGRPYTCVLPFDVMLDEDDSETATARPGAGDSGA